VAEYDDGPRPDRLGDVLLGITIILAIVFGAWVLSGPITWLVTR
jgi:hypothetical protein